MHIKMLLMDQGGGNKKTVTFPRPGVGNYLLQAWVSSLHKWEGGRRAIGPVAVFCALLVRSPKYALWSLI